MIQTPQLPVALALCASYESRLLREAVQQAVDAACDPDECFPYGVRVLVKPNLISARASARTSGRTPNLTPGQTSGLTSGRTVGLACTSPEIVRAVCEYLLDRGASVTVGDSPAFGTGARVARAVGIADALKGLGVKVADLGKPVAVPLTSGGTVGVAAHAMEADLLFNLPRLKVHGQMRMSLGIKNLFGCVPGARKAVAHARHGEKGNRFESLLTDVMLALPPAFTLLDGVRAMHVDGPIGGRPYAAELLAASESPVALDTALCLMLGLTPEAVPLWAEAQRRNLSGSRPEHLVYPLEQPGAFDFSGFSVPEALKPVSFHPLHLLRSTLRRAWARYF